MPKVKGNAINEWFARLPGSVGIGNVRYTTSGKCDDVSIVQGTQPFTASMGGVTVALSFNGNIVNNQPLKKEMEDNFKDFIFGIEKRTLFAEPLKDEIVIMYFNVNKNLF